MTHLLLIFFKMPHWGNLDTPCCNTASSLIMEQVHLPPPPPLHWSKCTSSCALHHHYYSTGASAPQPAPSTTTTTPPLLQWSKCTSTCLFYHHHYSTGAQLTSKWSTSRQVCDSSKKSWASEVSVCIAAWGTNEGGLAISAVVVAVVDVAVTTAVDDAVVVTAPPQNVRDNVPASCTMLLPNHSWT